MVDDFGQDHSTGDLLDTILHPIRSILRLRFTIVGGQARPLEEDEDRTVISKEDSIDTVILQPDHFGDCGHNLRGNPGGRCVCDAIVCQACLRRCVGCGSALCPSCSTLDGQTGQTLCRYCADEVSYRRRAAAVAAAVASLFVDFGRGKKDRS